MKSTLSFLETVGKGEKQMDNVELIIDLIVGGFILLMFVCVMIFCITFLISGIVEMAKDILYETSDIKTTYELISENEILK